MGKPIWWDLCGTLGIKIRSLLFIGDVSLRILQNKFQAREYVQQYKNKMINKNILNIKNNFSSLNQSIRLFNHSVGVYSGHNKFVNNHFSLYIHTYI